MKPAGLAAMRRMTTARATAAASPAPIDEAILRDYLTEP